MRWRDAGLWSRWLHGLAKRAKGRLCFSDASYIRVHQSGANPLGGQACQALGISRGGLTTKIHALVDGKGRAPKLLLRAGILVDLKMAPALVDDLRLKQCGTLEEGGALVGRVVGAGIGSPVGEGLNEPSRARQPAPEGAGNRSALPLVAGDRVG